MKLLTLLLLILLTVSLDWGDERVLPLETPNPVPISLVMRITREYHGELAATFRKGRWYFKNKDWVWCKAMKWPEGV